MVNLRIEGDHHKISVDILMELDNLRRTDKSGFIIEDVSEWNKDDHSFEKISILFHTMDNMKRVHGMLEVKVPEEVAQITNRARAELLDTGKE